MYFFSRNVAYLANDALFAVPFTAVSDMRDQMKSKRPKQGEGEMDEEEDQDEDEVDGKGAAAVTTAADSSALAMVRVSASWCHQDRGGSKSVASPWKCLL